MLRLLADDLTGALDSAARFVPLTGPLPVVWSGDAPAGHAALDSGTRNLDAAAAAERVAALAPLLADGAPAFKKIDSLLRGHVAVELAACMRWFDRCILAPAFPFQGRITIGGRQLVQDGDGWRDTGLDLAAALRAHGVDAELCDAATDAELDAIVAAGRLLPGRVLWCGTGGLAGALAETRDAPCPPLPGPVLALIGSDHAVALAQLTAVGDRLHRVTEPDAATISALRASLEGGAAAVCLALPPHALRAEAADRIGACFAALLHALPRPGTLVVAGGETLRDLCRRLGVSRLEVDGEVVPGVPTSRFCGGAWDGQRVVSKSGAFGAAGFLAELLGG
ncbi:MAG TPA: four-carbon acid sugar kinase family protein [Acetobacteraceae bacterium]|nr:four-carbon acid sugar kinase family protein [Acetobacteraceae bacterium]